MQVADGGHVVRAAFARGLRPLPALTVSEWSDACRQLSEVHAAEHGKYRTARTPYMLGIMDALGPECAAPLVVFMKGAQIGATEAGCNWVGWTIDHSPCPMLVVWPTLEEAKKNSKRRVAPMITSTPSLRSKVSDPRSRDSGNTQLQKEFPGGTLTITGANSSQGLASMPARRVLLDEVDRYPLDVDREGDPVKLAQARQRTFHDHKTLLMSTPTIAGRSRIAAAFDDSDRRYYLVPCPLCGHPQRLRWAGIKWEDGDPSTVTYQCESCEQRFEEHHKGRMLEAGEWVPERPELSDTVRGFHLNALYSPLGWYSWADAVAEFLEAKRNPDPSLLRVWVNTTLGECWVEKGDAPKWEVLYNRREEWKQFKVPAGGLVLTAGVDVQGGANSRLECEVVAWGRELQSWSVAYYVIPGDLAAPAVWRELDRVLALYFPNQYGVAMPVQMMAVDASFEAQRVYNWVRRKPRSRAMAVVGRGKVPVLVSQPTLVDVLQSGKRIRRGVLLWKVGVDIAKSELYGFLNQDQPTDPERDGFPPGWCHFPKDRSEEYFRQLCAEQLVPKMHRGRRVYEWEPTRERNEALDCRNYARAAAAVVGIDRWNDADWDAVERAVGIKKPKASGAPTPAAKPARQAKGSSYLQRGRGERWQLGRRHT